MNGTVVFVTQEILAPRDLMSEKKCIGYVACISVFLPLVSVYWKNVPTIAGESNVTPHIRLMLVILNTGCERDILFFSPEDDLRVIQWAPV